MASSDGKAWIAASGVNVVKLAGALNLGVAERALASEGHTRPNKASVAHRVEDAIERVWASGAQRRVAGAEVFIKALKRS